MFLGQIAPAVRGGWNTYPRAPPPPVCEAVSRPSVFYSFQLLYLDVDLLYRQSLSLIQIRDDRTPFTYLLLSVNFSLYEDME